MFSARDAVMHPQKQEKNKTPNTPFWGVFGAKGAILDAFI
jgi:hypothetical protein